MTPEEIVVSIAEIGYAKTYEILAALRQQEQQQESPDVLKLDWQHVIQRNQRAPVARPAPAAAPALSLFDPEPAPGE